MGTRGMIGSTWSASTNETHDPDLVPVVGWTPVLFDELHPTQAVPGLVGHGAGPFADLVVP